MCDCDQALEWISAALDGALTPEEQHRLDAHLAACAECRALAKELRQLQREMPGEAEVPAGFHQAVMDRIAAEQVVPFPPKKREISLFFGGKGTTCSAAMRSMTA